MTFGDVERFARLQKQLRQVANYRRHQTRRGRGSELRKAEDIGYAKACEHVDKAIGELFRKMGDP